METAITIGIVAFIILCCFIIQTLLQAQKSLKKLEIILTETDIKLRKLDSLINAIENVGEIAEDQTEKLKSVCACRSIEKKDSLDSQELASWLISSIKLGVKIFKRS